MVFLGRAHNVLEEGIVLHNFSNNSDVILSQIDAVSIDSIDQSIHVRRNVVGQDDFVAVLCDPGIDATANFGDAVHLELAKIDFHFE